MPDTRLADHLAAERSSAIRALLADPLINAESDADAFRVVVRHGDWLTNYFEQTCGWSLHVDPAAGFARLAKRTANPDITRPLRRTRGESAPFDTRRYQLLCLACAELVRHPVTTVGLLAGAVATEAVLDTSRHGERGAFVDALRVLISWGALRVSAGELDAFLDNHQANAILTAETARLHRLLVSASAPSALPGTLDTEQATRRLLDEPRYGQAAHAPDEISDESRNRWARHQVGRRVIDDPVVYLDHISATERDYLASISGRRWVRDRAAEAGLELEERGEGLLAIDPEATATDRRFPAASGHAYQLALLLIDQLVTTQLSGRRELGRLDPDQLEAQVAAVLGRFPTWARGRRDTDGIRRLTSEAVNLLLAFGLAAVEQPGGALVALPAIARYRIGDPVVIGAPTLFEENE